MDNSGDWEPGRLQPLTFLPLTFLLHASSLAGEGPGKTLAGGGQVKRELGVGCNV